MWTTIHVRFWGVNHQVRNHWTPQNQTVRRRQCWHASRLLRKGWFLDSRTPGVARSAASETILGSKQVISEGVLEPGHCYVWNIWMGLFWKTCLFLLLFGLRTAMWCVCLPFGEAILRHEYPHKEHQRTAKSLKSRWPVIYIRPYYIILYYLHQIFGKNAHFRSTLATSCNPQSHVPPIGVWPLWLCRPAGCEGIEWNLAGLQAFLLKPSTVDPGFRKLQSPSAYDFVGSKGGLTTHFFGMVSGQWALGNSTRFQWTSHRESDDTKNGIGGSQILTHTESIEPTAMTPWLKTSTIPVATSMAPVTIPLQSWGSFEMRHLSWELHSLSDGSAQTHLLT